VVVVRVVMVQAAVVGHCRQQHQAPYSHRTHQHTAQHQPGLRRPLIE
jgi:hypothetical protein